MTGRYVSFFFNIKDQIKFLLLSSGRERQDDLYMYLSVSRPVLQSQLF